LFLIQYFILYLLIAIYLLIIFKNIIIANIVNNNSYKLILKIIQFKSIKNYNS